MIIVNLGTNLGHYSMIVTRKFLIVIFFLVISVVVEKPKRVVIPVCVDSTQEEALSVLKSLKVCFLNHRD